MASHISKAATKFSTKFSPVVNSAASSAAEARAANAPASVLTIPSSVRYGPISISDLKDENNRTPAAAIRQVGTTRRVFILDSTMTAQEMDGLAYRIKVLSKNSSLNSILLSSNLERNDEDDVNHILPSSAIEIEKPYNPFSNGASPLGVHKGDVWNVSEGYDARSLVNESSDVKRQTINALMKLALSIKGAKADFKNTNNDYLSKIPFISVTHGLLSDGGYALAMGSYAFATSDSRFRIVNPSKGLSFDPIGLSYILPRLGLEFRQPCASYPVGQVLALTGYVADGFDMVETGLATNYMESVSSIGLLERSLAELPPYIQQALRKAPVRKYGQETESEVLSAVRDVNAQYRNIAVANLIHAVSDFDAASQDYASAKDEDVFLADEDPSLVLEGQRGSYIEERESVLLSIAATLEDVFKKEDSIQGIVERLKEYASADATYDDEREVVNTAKELLDSMESQSPLALHAVHKLMKDGKTNKQTLESCMEREKTVLLNLFEKADYKNWANSGLDAGEFKDWSHKSVHDVTSDEVKELFKE